VLEVEILRLADDAGVAGDGRAHEAGVELQDGIVVELGVEPLRRVDGGGFCGPTASIKIPVGT
jgi:hypothetical protein